MPLQRSNYSYQEESWIRTLFSFVNPLRGPGIFVALLATFVEEVGQDLPWYALVLICLTNLLAIRLVSLIIMEIVCCFLDIFFAQRKHQPQQQRNKAHRHQSGAQKRSPMNTPQYHRRA